MKDEKVKIHLLLINAYKIHILGNWNFSSEPKKQHITDNLGQ